MIRGTGAWIGTIAIAVATAGCGHPSGQTSHDAGQGPSDAGTAADAGPADAGPETPRLGSAGGSLTLIAPWQDFPTGIAVEGSTVYWANADQPGAILSAPVGGGTISTVEANRADPYNVVTDANNVYWIDYGTYDSSNDYNNDGAVLQAALGVDGGTVITFATALPAPNGLAVAGGNVFWAVGGMSTSDGYVASAPIGGGAVVTQASIQEDPMAVTADATNLYWANGGTWSSTTGAYNDDGQILQTVIGSGGSVIDTLASSQSYPWAITSDASKVYWTNEGSFDSNGNLIASTGSIVSAPIGGGGSPSTLASDQDNPLFIATDGAGNLYWVNSGSGNSNGSLVKLPSGGTPSTLVVGAFSPTGVALPATGPSVYFTDTGSSGIANGAVFGFTPGT